MNPLPHSGLSEHVSGAHRDGCSFLGHRPCWNRARFYGRTRMGRWPAKWLGKHLTGCRGIFNNKTGFYHMKKLKWFQDGENQDGRFRLEVAQDWLKQGNMADGARGPCRKSAGQGANLYGWKVR